MNTESIPAGFCQCGCGGYAPLAQRTDPRHGNVRGRPQRYIFGHYGRRTEPDEPPALCACGCGELTTVERGRAKCFIRGHNSTVRLITASDYTKEDRGYGTPCWIWKHAIGNQYGHGAVTVAKRKTHAHAAMYRQEIGEVPAGKELDHLCRVALCIRPSHLEPVPHAENCRRGAAAKLNHAQVQEIRSRYAEGGISHRLLALEYGVGKSTIGSVIGYKSWST